MLGQMILKEIRDNCLNARFMAAAAISFGLIIISVIILAGYVGGESRDYQNRVQAQNDFIDHFGHYNRLGWMAVQSCEPSHLQPLVLGIDREAAQSNFISDPVPVLLNRLDFVSIVTIIMSLVAILFSYDAISGEREAGVLRQLLATGVSRRTILLGKYWGGLISLVVPFTVSVLAGMVFLAFNPVIILQTVDFEAFGILLAASWLYIAVFFGIGIFFSATSQTSDRSILKSLFAWVTLVLVIPNVSPFLAAQLYPIPSAAKIHQEKWMITDQERDEIVRKRTRELFDTKFADLRDIRGLSQQQIADKLKTDPAMNERYRQFSTESEQLIKDINREQTAKAQKIGAEFESRSSAQENLAGILTSISPYADFVFIATDLAETGIEADNRWARQAGEYSSALWQFGEARYRKELERNPTHSSNDYLDLKDRPRFQFHPAGLMDRMGQGLPQWGILVAFSVLLFVGALAMFQRYDVR